LSWAVDSNFVAVIVAGHAARIAVADDLQEFAQRAVAVAEAVAVWQDFETKNSCVAQDSGGCPASIGVSVDRSGSGRTSSDFARISDESVDYAARP
jgi:hypothetical protein